MRINTNVIDFFGQISSQGSARDVQEELSVGEQSVCQHSLSESLSLSSNVRITFTFFKCQNHFHFLQMSESLSLSSNCSLWSLQGARPALSLSSNCSFWSKSLSLSSNCSFCSIQGARLTAACCSGWGGSSGTSSSILLFYIYFFLFYFSC